MAKILLMTAHGNTSDATNSDGSPRHSVADKTGLTGRLGYRPVFCTRLYPESLKLSWLAAWLAAPRYVDVIDIFWVEEDAVIQTDAWYWSQFCLRGGNWLDYDSEWDKEKERVFEVKNIPEWQREYLVKEIPEKAIAIPLVAATRLCDEYYPMLLTKIGWGDEEGIQSMKMCLYEERLNLEKYTEKGDFSIDSPGLQSNLMSAEILYNIWLQDSGLFGMIWALGSGKPVPSWIFTLDCESMGRQFYDAQKIRLEFTSNSGTRDEGFQRKDFERLQDAFYKSLDVGTQKISSIVCRDLYSFVGRNDLCPCGSGLKFKKCHGGNVRFDWLLEHPFVVKN